MGRDQRRGAKHRMAAYTNDDALETVDRDEDEFAELVELLEAPGGSLAYASVGVDAPYRPAIANESDEWEAALDDVAESSDVLDDEHLCTEDCYHGADANVVDERMLRGNHTIVGGGSGGGGRRRKKVVVVVDSEPVITLPSRPSRVRWSVRVTRGAKLYYDTVALDESARATRSFATQLDAAGHFPRRSLVTGIPRTAFLVVEFWEADGAPATQAEAEMRAVLARRGEGPIALPPTLGMNAEEVVRLARVRPEATAAALIVHAYERGGSRYMNLDGVVRERGADGVTIYRRPKMRGAAA